jgi:hypothetical protein
LIESTYFFVQINETIVKMWYNQIYILVFKQRTFMTDPLQLIVQTIGALTKRTLSVLGSPTFTGKEGNDLLTKLVTACKIEVENAFSGNEQPKPKAPGVDSSTASPPSSKS